MKSNFIKTENVIFLDSAVIKNKCITELCYIKIVNKALNLAIQCRIELNAI